MRKLDKSGRGKRGKWKFFLFFIFLIMKEKWKFCFCKWGGKFFFLLLETGVGSFFLFSGKLKRREIDQSVGLVTFVWDKSSIFGRYL